MPGHEDPEGQILMDKDGKLFVRSSKKEVVKSKPEVKEKEFDSADINKDGKVDIKDAVEVVKRFGRKKSKR